MRVAVRMITGEPPKDRGDREGAVGAFVVPGGSLMLAAHGYRSAPYHLERGIFAQDIPGAILAGLITHQFSFHALWQNPSQA
jgi:hypothetical protein